MCHTAQLVCLCRTAPIIEKLINCLRAISMVGREVYSQHWLKTGNYYSIKPRFSSRDERELIRNDNALRLLYVYRYLYDWIMRVLPDSVNLQDKKTDGLFSLFDNNFRISYMVIFTHFLYGNVPTYISWNCEQHCNFINYNQKQLILRNMIPNCIGNNSNFSVL